MSLCFDIGNRFGLGTARIGARSGDDRDRFPALAQKLHWLANGDLSGVVGSEREEVWIVADEMGGAAIDGTEQEHHILRVHGVVAKVKEDDRHDFAMPGDQADEGLDFGGGNTVGEQLFGILGEGIETVEEAELALLPAVEDFHRRARGVRAEVRRQHHIGVEHRTEGSGHLQTVGDVLPHLPELGKRFVPVESGGFVHLGFAHGFRHDLPRLGAVPLAANRLQAGLMPEIERDAEIQVGNACYPGLDVGGDVEGDIHSAQSVAGQDRRCNPRASLGQWRDSSAGKVRASSRWWEEGCGEP